MELRALTIYNLLNMRWNLEDFDPNQLKKHVITTCSINKYLNIIKKFRPPCHRARLGNFVLKYFKI